MLLSLKVKRKSSSQYTKYSLNASSFSWVPYYTLGGEVGGVQDSTLQAQGAIQS